MIENIEKEKKEIKLILDLHGHSKKYIISFKINLIKE